MGNLKFKSNSSFTFRTDRIGICVCACMHSQSYLTLQTNGLQPAKLLCPWNFTGKKTGECCHFKSKSVQFSLQSCSTLCDPMNCSTPSLPVQHQLLECTQTHFHRVDDAIKPSHPLSSPSPPALNLFQYQFSSVQSLSRIRLFVTP